MSATGISLQKCFTDIVAKRSPYETLWLQDLRQYKGIYDPEVSAKLVRSKSFVRETRTKVRTLDARIMDLLFPANGEKNWEVEPTPQPSLRPDVMGKILGVIAQAIREAGQQRPPSKEEVELAVKTFASETCKRMSVAIHDQLSELKYRSIIRDVMHSGHLYGTGWLKGPLVDQAMEQHWEMQQVPEGGMQWVLTTKKVNKPYAEFRPIWDCFPDMSVTDLDQCRFMCERHVMPRHKALALANRKDFNGAIIKNHISVNPAGKTTVMNYESLLYNLQSDNTKPNPTLTGMYEFIEYWGYVTTAELLDIDADKFGVLNLPDGDYPVCIWLLDNEVIKAAIQPISGVVIPYYVYYFDKDETSIFGEGIATIMRDSQKLVNAAIRAMIDNASHCAGPQYEVNVDLLDPGENPADIGAFKVWLRTGKDADVAGKEAVRIKTVQSYTAEFLNMYGLFSRLGDEVTIIPRYLQGDARVSGAGRTASGLSMLMGQANVGLTDLVKMFDDNITKPFITGMYNWNMQFNDDETIKGDMKVVPRGSTVLIAKEVRAQQIQTFLQMTLNPLDQSWTKRGNLLSKWAESTDIGADQAVVTEEEHERIVEQQMALNEQAQKQGANQEMQQVAGMMKQYEQAIAAIAEKVNNIEKFIAQSVQQTMMRKLPQPGGPNA